MESGEGGVYRYCDPWVGVCQRGGEGVWMRDGRWEMFYCVHLSRLDHYAAYHNAT